MSGRDVEIGHCRLRRRYVRESGAMPTTDAMPTTSDIATQDDTMCQMCGHLLTAHDVIGTRFCAATAAGELDRGCVCPQDR
jgi:hypothetical protein